MRIDHMISVLLLIVPKLHLDCFLLVSEQNHEVPAADVCCRSRPASPASCVAAQNLVQVGAISETRKESKRHLVKLQWVLLFNADTAERCYCTARCSVFFLLFFQLHSSNHFCAGQSSDPAKIVSVVITPDPPVKGQPITVEATFNLSMCLLHLHF